MKKEAGALQMVRIIISPKYPIRVHKMTGIYLVKAVLRITVSNGAYMWIMKRIVFYAIWLFCRPIPNAMLFDAVQCCRTK
jgi:hypothetical protein